MNTRCSGARDARRFKKRPLRERGKKLAEKKNEKKVSHHSFGRAERLLR